MNKTQRRAKPEIKSNTAYRGIGAIVVMLFHYSSYKLASGEVVHIFPFGENVALTLDLFFMLSGFVIAYIYADIFAAGPSRGAAQKFFWQRFVRIYPVHIFALAVFVCERAAYVLLESHNVTVFSGSDPGSFFYVYEGIANTPFTLMANILMIHALGVTPLLSWNYPSWTVSAEFAAYFAFPLMCLVIARTGRYAAAILIGLALAAYLAIEAHYGTVDAPGNVGAIRVIPGFMVGVALCLLAGRVERLSTRQLHLVQTFALVAALLGLALFDFQTPLVLLLAFLVLVTVPGRGWVSNLLDWQVLQFLGRTSYSIYMTHVVVGIAIKQVMNVLGPALGIDELATWWPHAVMAAQFGATIVFATLVFYYIEMPARSLLSGLVKRRGAPAVVGRPTVTP